MKKCLAFVFFLLAEKNLSAQESRVNFFDTSSATKTIIHNNDTLVFERPRILKNISMVPRNVWSIVKSPVRKRNIIGLSATALATGILIWKDQQIIKWVRSASDQVGLAPTSDFKVLLQAGNTRILKVPRNLNTFLYQLGEGGTSLALAGGIWAYGKIKKDLRATNTAADLAETYITMGITSQLIKRMTGRESPFVATKAGGRW